MSNFVQVNVISHSKNSLSSCYEHNVERLKDGENLPHLLEEYNILIKPWYHFVVFYLSYNNKICDVLNLI